MSTFLSAMSPEKRLKDKEKLLEDLQRRLNELGVYVFVFTQELGLFLFAEFQVECG